MPSTARAIGAGTYNALTVTETVRAIAAGETTCEAVVQDCLVRIEQREEIVHAWASIDPELALPASATATRHAGRCTASRSA